MRANNLTISIPNKGCDKNPPCPYCVSKCTGVVKEKRDLMLRNIPKVLTMARLGQVSSVMLTGKGEPCLNFNDVLMFCEHFREFPLEIQTNGIWLSRHILTGEVPVLAGQGMNVVAISADEFGSTPIEVLSKAIHDTGMLLRMTFNVTNAHKFRELTFQSLLDYCIKWDVDQLTIRKIVAPNYTEETEQTEWIKDNVDLLLYPRLMDELKTACKKSGHHIRSLPFGAEVYDVQGVSVSYSNYCIQDDNDMEDIRSLIFLEDGHMYSSWNSKASVLF
jgi:hypothetical protein